MNAARGTRMNATPFPLTATTDEGGKRSARVESSPLLLGHFSFFFFFNSSNNFLRLYRSGKGSVDERWCSLYEFISLRTIRYKNPITGHPDTMRARTRTDDAKATSIGGGFAVNKTQQKPTRRALKTTATKGKGGRSLRAPAASV